MTHAAQLRLLCALTAVTCLTALIGAGMVSAPTTRSVAVEGAFGWLDEDRPTELALHIHLLNLKNSDETVVGVSAQDGRAATLSRQAPAATHPKPPTCQRPRQFCGRRMTPMSRSPRPRGRFRMAR